MLRAITTPISQRNVSQGLLGYFLICMENCSSRQEKGGWEGGRVGGWVGGE